MSKVEKLADAASVGQTVFERTWDSIIAGELRPPGLPAIRPIFISRQHRIMAFVDPFAKFANHVVVAPSEGNPGKEVHFHRDLSPTRQLQLNYVANRVGALMLHKLGLETEIEPGPSQRIIDHLEGFAVRDHAHLVIFSAHRTEGARLYEKDALKLEPDALDAMQQKLHFPPTLSSVVDHALLTLEENAAVLNLSEQFLAKHE